MTSLHSSFESPLVMTSLHSSFESPLVMTSLHSSSESPWLWHPYTAVLKAPGYDILTQQFWKPLVMTSLHSSFESPWLWHPYTAVLKAPGDDILTQQFWKPLVMTSLHSSFESPWLWHPYTAVLKAPGYDILTWRTILPVHLPMAPIQSSVPAVWNTKKAEQPNGSYQPVTNGYNGIGLSYDDVMPWNCFWPIVWGNHQTLMDSPHKGPVVQMFDNVGQNRLLGKQSNCWCFKMPWFSCDVPVRLMSEDEIWAVVVQ